MLFIGVSDKIETTIEWKIIKIENQLKLFFNIKIFVKSKKSIKNLSSNSNKLEFQKKILTENIRVTIKSLELFTKSLFKL